MTVALMARVAALEHVTTLGLGGSPQLSDVGLFQLARMPQLERLDLSGYPGGTLTDRGLEVLRHLPHLRQFGMTWQKGISDAGVANLRFCERLEDVTLMGSPTGEAPSSRSRGSRSSGGSRPDGRSRIRACTTIDAGFEALSRSATLEGLWGRECPNFGSRGFLALSRMPSLRALGIGP